MNKNVPKVIGEGSYGCVHKPSLECSSGNINYKDKVSKVLEISDAKQEIKEHAVIHKIDPNYNFYLGDPISCNIKNNSKNIHSIAKCKTKKELINNLDSLSLLVLNDGGVNLEEFAKHMSQQKNTKENKKNMEKFWIEGLRLLYGIKLLIENHTIHHDLKPQNIVYNDKINRMNLIDFGFMTNKKNVISLSKKSKNFFGDYHWSFPPELYFYNKENYINHCNKSQEEKSNYFNELINDIKTKKNNKFSNAIRTFFYFTIDQTLHNNIYSSKIDYFVQNLNELIIMNFNEKNEYTHFLNDSIDTIDIYGMGISYIYVLHKTKHLLDKSVYERLYELFNSMICPNYLERPNINTIIIQYNNIIKNANYFNNNESEYNKLMLIENITNSLSFTNTIQLSKKDTSIDVKKIKKEIENNIYGCNNGLTYSMKNKKCIRSRIKKITKKNKK
jgi:serine/threonine protein kinase